MLSHDLLRQILCLPDDADIVAIAYNDPITCKVWVTQKDIPESKEGEVRELLPIFKREGEQVTLVEWGIRERINRS